MSDVEIELALRLVVAVILGGFIGIEREIVHKPAGLRTHMLVSLGSCLVTIVSVFNFQQDPARIAAGIITGIGFIGAGTIWVEKDKIVGLTTAASLWITASVGLTVGVGEYAFAVVSTVLAVLILFLGKIRYRKGDGKTSGN